MMRYISLILALVAVASGQTPAPSIANVTNAALPAIDLPPNSVTLTPRSMATIFGTNLADFTISAAPPWQKSLAGTEVHLVVDQISSGTFQGGITSKTTCSEDCDLIVDMVYASPTQINFVTPDVATTNSNEWIVKHSRIVLVRDGVRFDNLFNTISGTGLVTLDPVWGDGPVVFEAGYDCLFSYSLTDPASCGFSWSQGQHRAPLGAITDALSGQLISSQSPVHQGQIITLWMTGLSGLTLNNNTGLLQQAQPGSFGFGVAQLGTDIAATVQSGMEGQYGTFVSPTPMWAGESPQFVGLDQVNVAFPTCSNPPASTEKRYDAFLIYMSMATLTTVRIYLPFVVRQGDPDCQWLNTLNTTTTLTSSANPSGSGEAITFTATVMTDTSMQPAATGSVTFFDGGNTLGEGTLEYGIAGWPTTRFTSSSLSWGSHSIVATYNGDAEHAGSSASLTQTVSKTSITLTSSPNPSTFGQAVAFTATVSPSLVTGTVTFAELTCSPAPCSVKPVAIGSGTLSGGTATFTTSSLSADTHSITATYGGDTNAIGSTSSWYTQTVKKAPATIMITSSSPNPSISGQTVTFTATVSPLSATGSVTFYDNGPNSTYGQVSCLGAAYGISVSLSNGQAKCIASSLSGGPGIHSITATYSGDSNNSGVTSSAFIQTVKQPTGVSLTSSANPSVFGQSVTFTAFEGNTNATGTMTFYDGGSTIGISTVSKAQASFSTTMLSVGNHSITAAYSGDNNYGSSTSVAMTQTVTAH